MANTERKILIVETGNRCMCGDRFFRVKRRTTANDVQYKFRKIKSLFLEIRLISNDKIIK